MLSTLVGLFAYGMTSITDVPQLQDLIVLALNPLYELFLGMGL